LNLNIKKNKEVFPEEFETLLGYFS